MQKGQKLPPKQRHKLELDLKGLPDAITGSKLAEGLANRAPDLFLLGGGFFLGYVMNMRPGLELPGGIFIGFPDFGGEVKRLQKIVDTLESEIEKEGAQLIRNDAQESVCVQQANEAFLKHRDTFRLAADVSRCQERNISKTRIADLAKEKAELTKHKIAQGLLMATMVYAFTRSGFVQGIGEIIPG